MAADLTFSVDDSALEHTTLALLRESYSRILTGRVCRVHGRGVRVTAPVVSNGRRGAPVAAPADANELNLSGCCEAFMLEARSALRQHV
jgi:hypothetical protein